MFCERINGNVTAIGISLYIPVILAELYPANTELLQGGVHIPFRQLYRRQLVALGLGVRKDAASRPKADNGWFSVGVVISTLGEDRQDDFKSFAAAEDCSAKGVPSFQGSDRLPCALQPHQCLVGVGVIVETIICLPHIPRHFQACPSHFSPIHLTPMLHF